MTWLIEDNTSIWSMDGSSRLVQEGEDHLSLMVSTPLLLMFLYLNIFYNCGFDYYDYYFDHCVYLLHVYFEYLDDSNFLNEM